MSLFACIEYFRARRILLQPSSLLIAFLLHPLRRSHVLGPDERRFFGRAQMWRVQKCGNLQVLIPGMIELPVKAPEVPFWMP
jgi:hypothetical protein